MEREIEKVKKKTKIYREKNEVNYSGNENKEKCERAKETDFKLCKFPKLLG